LVSLASWNHSEPIPHSVVKCDSGDDTLGVAPRDNSPMPSFLFSSQLPSLLLREGFCISMVFVIFEGD